jgi:hypothetical protein
MEADGANHDTKYPAVNPILTSPQLHILFSEILLNKIGEPNKVMFIFFNYSRKTKP